MDWVGSATIGMLKKDPLLSEKIIKIIQEPTYMSMAGRFPKIATENIKIWDPSFIKSLDKPIL